MPKKRPQPPKTRRTDPSSDAVEYKPFAGLKAMRESLAPDKTKGKPGSPAPTHPSKPTKAPPADPVRDKEDDRLSMHRLMSGVKPLDARPQRLPRSQGIEAADRVATSRAAVAERVEAEAKAEADAVHAHLRELVDGTARRFEVTDDGRRVEGRRTEMRADALRKLRHGLFPIDARIDLHGMTSSNAREALDRFLADQRARGERCVLVIHGKGEHSPRGMGVLRGEIAAWLSQGSGSAHVAAFATAGAGDGGEGAVYVLLTR